MAGSTRVGDWQCPNTACINHTQFPTNFVYASKVNCPKCGTGKSAQRAGDWCCPNPQCVNHQNTVYGSKMNCSRCGAPKPALNAKGGAVLGAPPPGYVAVSPVCGPTHFGSAPVPVMAAPSPQVRPGGVSAPRVGDWHCPNPECKNHTDNVVYGSKTSCPICGMEKPAPPKLPPAAPHGPPPPEVQRWAQAQWASPGAYVISPPAMRMPVQPGMANRPRGQPGDWHCANLGCKNHRDNVVYASKSSCPLCGMEKPENGGVIIPPPPTQRPGDWHCPNVSCKNHINGVYASKSQCSMCGALKPEPELDRQRSRSPRAE